MAEVEAQLGAGAGPKFDSVDRNALLQQLDEMLAHYLNTLDKYQKAQQQLASFLSSGYLSLAQANFNNDARTRFGQDYYDERMRASRKLTIDVDESDVTFSLSAPEPLAPGGSQPEAEKSADSTAELPEGLLADSKGPRDGTSKGDEKDSFSSDGKIAEDPLRWFGILVPPALRSAQATFVSAVEGPIPQLATITKELRRQEVDIGRVRKQIKKL